MANKIKVKLILELHAAGMSRNMIAATRHISKSSVSDVIHRAGELSVTHSDIMEKSDEDVYRLFYPDKHAVETLYKDPVYDYVHEELKKTGVTLKLLWDEYRTACVAGGGLAMGYTKYCKGYSQHTIKKNLTNHLMHKPGIAVEVDWSGKKMEYTCKDTCETVKVSLFVGTLPYSQYSYVECCLDQKEETWLRCHVRMFEYLGGSPVKIVCDNLKTGVIKHPKEGDIVLNDGYEALGSHYMTAIMPTGVRKPKQKASVEGTVGKVATAIIAKLRNERFGSLPELKDAAGKALESFNGAPFQKRDGSRKEVFFGEEKQYLRKLPALSYEIATWVYGRAVNFDCHVIYEKNRYSCPYRHVGGKADLKITDSTVEIYCGGERVATHSKLPDYVSYGWSTHAEDMPDQFQKPEWDDVRIKKWARSIGIHAGEVIDRIFEAVMIKEQGYNASLSVLRLSKTYSPERLEAACELALSKAKTPRYHHLKSILAANQDQRIISHESESDTGENGSGGFGYIRGAAYYGGDGYNE